MKVERYKAVRAKDKEAATSESRSRLLLSSCSTDQFYNYVTKVTLKDTVETDETIGPSVPFVVMRHVSLGATETEGSEDTRTLASEPGLALGSGGHREAGRRSGSLGRLGRLGSDAGGRSTAASSDNELWKMRGRRMAIDLGELRQQQQDADADNQSNIIDELDWRRGRRMAIDMTAMCDDVIVDVDQIVTTGGIFDAFTTDTGSDDSFLATLDERDVVGRRRLDAGPAPTTPSSRSSSSRAAAAAAVVLAVHPSSSSTELRIVPPPDTANCVDGINHHIVDSLRAVKPKFHYADFPETSPHGVIN